MESVAGWLGTQENVSTRESISLEGDNRSNESYSGKSSHAQVITNHSLIYKPAQEIDVI